MSLWENENNQNENGEQNNDAMEANFTVKDSGNENAGDTTDEKPTYVFENLYKNGCARTGIPSASRINLKQSFGSKNGFGT